MHIYRTELKKLITRTSFWVIVLLLLGIVFLDFYLTCRHYAGQPLSEIPSAYDLIVISNEYSGSLGTMFFQSFIFILIVALIGSDTFFIEKEHGIQNFVFTRVQCKKYVLSQAAAVMTTVFLIVFFMILISQLLALTAFPFQGYMIDDSIAYNSLLAHPSYIFSKLDAYFPYLNNIVYAVLWGIVGAVFSLLSYSLAFLHQLKRHTIVLIPSILFLAYNLVTSQMAGYILKTSQNIPLAQAVETYLLKRNGTGSIWVYVGILLVIVIGSVGLIWRGLHNDQELL